MIDNELHDLATETAQRAPRPLPEIVRRASALRRRRRLVQVATMTVAACLVLAAGTPLLRGRDQATVRPSQVDGRQCWSDPTPSASWQVTDPKRPSLDGVADLLYLPPGEFGPTTSVEFDPTPEGCQTDQDAAWLGLHSHAVSRIWRVHASTEQERQHALEKWQQVRDKAGGKQPLPVGSATLRAQINGQPADYQTGGARSLRFADIFWHAPDGTLLFGSSLGLDVQELLAAASSTTVRDGRPDPSTLPAGLDAPVVAAVQGKRPGRYVLLKHYEPGNRATYELKLTPTQDAVPATGSVQVQVGTRQGWFYAWPDTDDLKDSTVTWQVADGVTATLTGYAPRHELLTFASSLTRTSPTDPRLRQR